MQKSDLYLDSLRQFELENTLHWFPDTGENRTSILEIGAGSGYQASLLAERGFNVVAVDVASSAYRNQRVFPVIEYDGSALPVASGSMQVVFSSNVLEHVRDIDAFLNEMRRVMSNDGYAIHILPTSAWRFWSIVGHYGWLVKRIATYVVHKAVRKSRDAELVPQAPRTVGALLGTFFPMRHGERGNSITEMYYYSCRWWQRKFMAHGYQVVASYPAGLFYSGACVFGGWLTISARRHLSRWLGSACRVYVLRRNG